LDYIHHAVGQNKKGSDTFMSEPKIKLIFKRD